MRYNIRGENIEITEAIRDYVEKKVGKIERYFNASMDCNVYANIRTYHNSKSKIEVTIPMKHITLRAEERNDDLYAGIDLVVDKLERQIRKHKTKVNRKMREKNLPDESFHSTFHDEEHDENESEIKIIRTKHFSMKPMDAEEAVLQMNLLGHTFFIFVDADTRKTNAVYKREDGTYGLIESME